MLSDMTHEYNIIYLKFITYGPQYWRQRLFIFTLNAIINNIFKNSTEHFLKALSVNLTHGYSLKSSQRELSNEYPCVRVWVIFGIFTIF